MGNKKILITAATGVTGSAAAANLLGLGIPVRALVHRIDARSEQLRAQGAEIIEGDLLDFAVLDKALIGITGAYFCYPIQIPGIIESTAFFAQAALDAGVGTVVNMSQISACRISKSVAARNHWIAERLLDRSGIPVTHLRPTFFAEWLIYFAESIRKDNVLPLPFGDARYAPITAEDQGRVISAILNDPTGHAGKIYPLYGPTELSEYEVADLLTEILGRKISYQALEIKGFMPVWEKTVGSKTFNQQHIASVAQECREGLFSGTNDWVEKITLRKPLGMRQFIVQNKGLFA
ncbi:putative nucleoside-diphosphate-sugar epimerase [Acidisarcina polymorpha]|uniref:Putative nucleoside-diphosphate-sugar epimerase n=1 Tax=Acidisarcina polymorpha TaxID=2211140 RepID=A0A2Z5FS91_9BACT|nr:NmrA family NAD(P)-binding protein [Acidisarcina polymorpha]AXC09658.1 putative nucleoside-diphosphate-sugar epimerase [Acidisarcina polymorpha]